MKTKDENKKNELSAKERLLCVAIRNFAEKGFEGASTREITEKAKVNISSISYYFGDKEGLYNASLELISDQIDKKLTAHAIIATNELKSRKVSNERKQEMVHDVFSRFVDVLLDDSTSPYVAKIFLREHLEEGERLKKFYEKGLYPLHRSMSEFMSYIIDKPVTQEQLTIIAHTMVGMISIFKNHQYAIMLRLGWDNYGEKEIEKIKKIVLENIDCLINHYNNKNF